MSELFSETWQRQRLKNIGVPSTLKTIHGPQLTPEQWKAYDELVVKVVKTLITEAAAKYEKRDPIKARYMIPKKDLLVRRAILVESVRRLASEVLMRHGFMAVVEDSFRGDSHIISMVVKPGR